MKKILLFGDIGGHERERYYHVGDEAMWSETYRWYKEHHPNWKITSVTWNPADTRISDRNTAHLSWPPQRGARYFLTLLGKLFLWRVTSRHLFTPVEWRFISQILLHDRIHFTGGGNLTTQFRPWLYYCFFVLLTAKVCRKEILLLSQTLGPFRGVDTVIAPFFLNFASVVAVRSRLDAQKIRSQHGLLFPHVFSMVDAAYSLTAAALPALHTRGLRIGLSLHSWKGESKNESRVLHEYLQWLTHFAPLTLVLIPHHLTYEGSGPDLMFMEKLVDGLPVEIEKPIDLSTLTVRNPARLALAHTSRVDLLLTTRYHGIIFAVAQNVPTIALNRDAYYQQKNNGALEMFYEKNASFYQVAMSELDAFTQMKNITHRILKNLKKEKIYIQEINGRVIQQEYTLHTLMNTLETKILSS